VLYHCNSISLTSVGIKSKKVRETEKLTPGKYVHHFAVTRMYAAF
jgi:hypothetical protein